MSDDDQEAVGTRRRGRTALRVGGAVLLTFQVALLVCWVCLRAAPDREAAPGTLSTDAVVAGVPQDHPKQGPEQCGAYSLAWALRACGREARPGDLVERVSHSLSWSDSLSGTLPWRILEVLEERGLGGRAFTARDLPPECRLDVLRSHVAGGRPVIVLIESERGNQHYVVVAGYGPDSIAFYDPNAEADPDQPERTLDTNAARVGNRTLESWEFLDRWSRGGALGLYGWWYVPVGSESESE